MYESGHLKYCASSCYEIYLDSTHRRPRSPLNDCTVLTVHVYCSSLLNFSYPLLSTEHCSLHVLNEYRKALDLTLDLIDECGHAVFTERPMEAVRHIARYCLQLFGGPPLSVPVSPSPSSDTAGRSDTDTGAHEARDGELQSQTIVSSAD